MSSSFARVSGLFDSLSGAEAGTFLPCPSFWAGGVAAVFPTWGPDFPPEVLIRCIIDGFLGVGIELLLGLFEAFGVLGVLASFLWNNCRRPRLKPPFEALDSASSAPFVDNKERGVGRRSIGFGKFEDLCLLNRGMELLRGTGGDALAFALAEF